MFGAASIGYSPPSVFELLEPQNGVLSTELEAETAQNLEVGEVSYNRFGAPSITFKNPPEPKQNSNKVSESKKVENKIM